MSKQMKLKDLKAEAYDLLLSMQEIQRKLSLINTEIERLSQDTTPEEEGIRSSN